MTGHIRLAPERQSVPITDTEAIDASRRAFDAARRAHSSGLVRAGYLTAILFDDRKVTYARLKSMRHETRDVIEKFLAVETALSTAIEAMEATQDSRS